MPLSAWGSEAYRASRVVFVQDVSFEFFTGTGDHLEFIAQRPGPTTQAAGSAWMCLRLSD
jgi:hypothetical protein